MPTPKKEPVLRKTPAKSKSGAVVPVDKTDSREFRKTNDAIGLRVKEGKLSLLTRKVFNVMMYHAQELKQPGVNAPIDTPASKKYFWIPLSELARDSAYDSKDTEFLKEQLQELQNVKLLLENERQWVSERLVSSIQLVNPQGLKKHTGQVWFGYAFPPEVHELVMAPGTYTKFSIFYQGLLRSGAALALYEVCRRYATNPSRLTLIESPEHWYGVLTGSPVTAENLPPYKYFKRDILKLAIAEVNALTDITVELVEHKNGRRVENLQFRVSANQQPQLAFPAGPVIDTELLSKVMGFGFAQETATDFMALHGDQKIRTTIGFVEARIVQKNSAPLDSPAAYFRWALKEGAAAERALITKLPGKATAVPQAGDGSTLMEKFLSARAEEALEIYHELDAVDQGAVFDRFRTGQPASKTLKYDKALSSVPVRKLFARWYAMDLWPEITPQQLATFVERYAIYNPPQS